MRIRDEDWRLLRTSVFGDCTALDLASQDRPGVNRTLLVPFDRPHRASPPRAGLLPARGWCQAVASVVADSFPFGGLRFCPDAIRLLPYQLEPALAVFRHGATRLLVADDVGVGKTVEAGLIVREVVGAGHAARVLILVPASLKDQWKQELATLFDIDVLDADARWLQQSSAHLPTQVNPWGLPGVYLASTDFVKRAEALHPLEAVRWDLLVLDEAHAATPHSYRRAAVEALAVRSRRVVLLTATPHGGDDGQFEQLCGTGAVDRGESIVCFRRSRADVEPLGQPVKSRVIRVRVTADERRLHRELDAYTARLWAAAGGRPERNPALLATLLRKRALSSIRSLVLSLERRRHLMAAPPPAQTQLWLPLEDDDRTVTDDVEMEDVLRGEGIGEEGEERAWIERALEAARPAASAESKVRVLLRMLARVREPAIVFSEYRDTAEQLQQVLAAGGHSTIGLHGGLSAAERRSAIAEFNRGGAVLVATDAASEGLNLHYRCRLVVHFELPWTPARLQQRCGRVSRIGQCRTVHEIALVADDTAEQLVVCPLVRRAGRAGDFGAGSMMAQLTETRVASEVLGDPITAATPASVPSLVRLDLREEAAAEAERLELVRRARRLMTGSGKPVVPAARGPLGGDEALTFVVSVAIRDRRGGPLDEQVTVISGRFPGWRWRRGRRARRRQIASLLERVLPLVSRRLVSRVGRRLAAVRAMREAVRANNSRREEAIEGALRSAARGLVQAGLFDRPAGRRAAPFAVAPILADPPPLKGGGRPLLRARIRLRAVLFGSVE